MERVDNMQDQTHFKQRGGNSKKELKKNVGDQHYERNEECF